MDMKLRSDFRSAVLMENCLHHKSGEQVEEPIHPGQQTNSTREDYFSSARVDQHTGWEYWPSSTSSSWWYASEWSWKRASNFLNLLESLLQLMPPACGQIHLTRLSRHFHPCAHITLSPKVSHDVSA